MESDQSPDCWPRTFGAPSEEGRVTRVPSGTAVREEPGEGGDDHDVSQGVSSPGAAGD